MQTDLKACIINFQYYIIIKTNNKQKKNKTHTAQAISVTTELS